jgi:hypothetical protein
MAGALSVRLTWRLFAGTRGAAGGAASVGSDGDGGGLASGGSPGWAAVAPAALAGLITMASLALTGEFLDASTLGYSEGLMVAALLIAVDRHLDGHFRQAFVFGFVAALDRPEVWLFWGPYGLWLMWRDPGARGLVIGLAVLTLFLWFVPQKWGGGSWTSGITRAHHPRSNSPAFASCPFCAELKDHAWPLVLLRIKVAAALTVLCALFVLWRTRSALAGWRSFLRRRGSSGVGGRALPARPSALVTLIVCGVFGLAWWVLVALETQAGFSGNDRYLVLGSAFIVLVGGVGYGWLAIGLARLAARGLRGAARGGLVRLSAVAASGVCALLYVLGPNFVGSNLIDIPRTHGSLLYQAHLREDLVSLIRRAGGAGFILGCGPVMTEGFQVPMVAWYLNVRTIRVTDQPATNAQGLAPVKNRQWPATIFQDRDNRGAALLPLPQTIRGWEHQGAHYKFVPGPHHAMYLFQGCRAHAAGAA